MPSKADVGVTPIRPGVNPTADLEREMLDYCHRHIRSHTKHFDEPPTAMAVVSQSANGYRTSSWSPVKGSDRTAVCSTAAALLLKRAMEDDDDDDVD